MINNSHKDNFYSRW